MEQELTSEEILNKIIEVCIKEGASDVHIDPKKGSADIQFRINGLLQIKDSISLDRYQEILSKIKIQCNLRIDDHLSPKDGSFEHSSSAGHISFRVSILPTRFGENIVLRALPYIPPRNLKDLGIKDEDRQIILFTLKEPGSIAIVMGPTGSGKTTTLYALLNELKTEELMAISIEDPIESQLDDIRQVQIGYEKVLNFSNALRAALRQDPDIILVGEIRDYETAILAFQAALTGHIVLTSIHAYDSSHLIPRLLAIGIPEYLIEALKIVSINQRLIGRLCEHCKKEVFLTEEEMISWQNFSEMDSEGKRFFGSSGCEICNYSGISGRTLAYEISGSGRHIKNCLIDLILTAQASYKLAIKPI